MKTINNNNNDISTELVDMFPISIAERTQQVFDQLRWPLSLGLVTAGVFAVGMLIGTGALVVPGAAFLSALKGVTSIWVKRSVISISSMVGFGVGFGLSKWFGARRSGASQPSHVALRKEGYAEYDTPILPKYRPLPEPLRISNRDEHVITHYSEENQMAILLYRGKVKSSPTPIKDIFVPLKKMVQFEYQHHMMYVTHYKQSERKFLVLYLNQEYSYSQNDLRLLKTYGTKGTRAPMVIHYGSQTRKPQPQNSLMNQSLIQQDKFVQPVRCN